MDQPDAAWTITAWTPAEANMIARLKRAGVQPHEVARHAGEIVLSLAGVKKLAAWAPDQTRVNALVRFCEQVAHDNA